MAKNGKTQGSKRHINYFLIAAIIIILLSYSVFLFLDNETIASITDEDSLFENLTAFFFFMASGCFFALFMASKSGNDFCILKTKKNIIFLLFSILFFFGMGEEISWGQRILDIRTPEYFKEVNYQKEINIHNLDFFHRNNSPGSVKSGFELMFTFDRLYAAFILVSFIIVPLAALRFNWFRTFIEKLNFPSFDLALAPLFAVNYIIAKIIKFLITNPHINTVQSITEIKEANFAILFFFSALALLKDNNKI